MSRQEQVISDAFDNADNYYRKIFCRKVLACMLFLCGTLLVGIGLGLLGVLD